jgi:hypothetical protein
MRKEAARSSQTEGTRSSLQDLLAAEAQLFEPTLPREPERQANDDHRSVVERRQISRGSPPW